MMRPVVITVKDGEMPSRRGSTNEPTETLEFKSTFLVGQSARRPTSPPRVRKVTPEKKIRFEKQTRCKSPERRSKSPDRKSKSRFVPSSPLRRQNNFFTERQYTPRQQQQQQQQKDYSPSKHSPNRRSMEMDDIKTEKERERRNRWFKGVVRSWKDDADLATAFGEESTYATNSCYTDSDGYSYSDDDTYSYESSRLGGRGGGGRSRHQRHNSYSSSRDLSEPIFSSVAQDLGVVAQMILSDGAACITSAAEITKESIANCRTQDMRF